MGIIAVMTYHERLTPFIKCCNTRYSASGGGGGGVSGNLLITNEQTVRVKVGNAGFGITESPTAGEESSITFADSTGTERVVVASGGSKGIKGQDVAGGTVSGSEALSNVVAKTGYSGHHYNRGSSGGAWSNGADSILPEFWPDCPKFPYSLKVWDGGTKNVLKEGYIIPGGSAPGYSIPSTASKKLVTLDGLVRITKIA